MDTHSSKPIQFTFDDLRQSNNLKSSNQWGMTRLKLEDLVLAAQGRLFSALMILMNSLESRK